MNTSDIRVTKLVCGGFVLVGSILGIVGIVWMNNTAAFVKRASKAPGTVIAIDYSRSSPKGGSVPHPVYTFADAAGIVHTQRMSSGSDLYSFEPGEKVRVLYDPAAPKHSNIDSFLTLWLGPFLATGFGLLLVGFSCSILLVATREKGREKEKSAA
jgi:hypothetical protein